MSRAEQVLGRLVVSNNERIHRVDGGRTNPRPLAAVEWHSRLVSAWPDIRAEWDRFESCGGRLPLIEDLIDEHQGNEGAWCAGLLVSRGRPCGIADRFPVTVRALGEVPGLRSALWSQMAPGTELPSHAGPNAGVLRYHLGVRCGSGSGLQVGSTVVPYVEREGVLFDDTEMHAAWNRGSVSRVTLFCEVARPLPRVDAVRNRLVQSVIVMDPRYRRAPARAAQWDTRLNGPSPT